jgi:hypothetical protein
MGQVVQGPAADELGGGEGKKFRRGLREHIASGDGGRVVR